MAFGTYVAMGAAVNASTTFAVTCTTVALGATNANGSGVAQTYTINGAIPAGQAGTCTGATCSGSQTRTLTITY